VPETPAGDARVLLGGEGEWIPVGRYTPNPEPSKLSATRATLEGTAWSSGNRRNPVTHPTSRTRLYKRFLSRPRHCVNIGRRNLKTFTEEI